MTRYYRRHPIDAKDKKLITGLLKSTTELVTECETILPGSFAAKCRKWIRELAMIAYDLGYAEGNREAWRRREKMGEGKPRC